MRADTCSKTEVFVPGAGVDGEDNGDGDGDGDGVVDGDACALTARDFLNGGCAGGSISGDMGAELVVVPSDCDRKANAVLAANCFAFCGRQPRALKERKKEQLTFFD